MKLPFIVCARAFRFVIVETCDMTDDDDDDDDVSEDLSKFWKDNVVVAEVGVRRPMVAKLRKNLRRRTRRLWLLMTST